MDYLSILEIMELLLTILIFAGIFLLFGAGYFLARKSLTRGCAVDPDSCTCRKEGKNPSQCDT